MDDLIQVVLGVASAPSANAEPVTSPAVFVSEPIEWFIRMSPSTLAPRDSQHTVHYSASPSLARASSSPAARVGASYVAKSAWIRLAFSR